MTGVAGWAMLHVVWRDAARFYSVLVEVVPAVRV